MDRSSSAMIQIPHSHKIFLFVCLLLVGLLMAPVAEAQVSDPFLLEDVNSDAFGLLRVDDYFELERATVMIRGSGNVLSTDGTQAGTVRLTDALGVTRPIGVTPDGEHLFFVGGANEPNLWVTDGTPAGTVQLTTEGDVEQPVVLDSFISPTSGQAFFIRRPEFLPELWTSDGTVSGTHRISLDAFPEEIFSFVLGAEIDGSMIFGARSREQSWLAQTDGVTAEPILGADEVGVGGREGIREFAVLGDRVVFRGRQEATGDELWVTDGTAGGTRLLVESVPGSEGGNWLSPVRAGSRVFAPVRREDGARTLYGTDGTPAGTRELVTFPNSADLALLNLQSTADGVVFVGWSEEAGFEPWFTDGTVGGTRLLKDLCPGPCSSTFFRGNFQVAGPEGRDRYLVLDEGRTGLELYVTDGTTQGTRQVADLCPGACSAKPQIVALRDKRLFFLARDGVRGLELYVTENGSPPVRLTDFPQRRPFVNTAAGVLDDRLILLALDVEEGAVLWQSDGTVPGTSPLVTLVDPPLSPASGFPSGFASMGSDLFFTGYDALDRLTLYRKRGLQPAERLDVVDSEALITSPTPTRSAVAGGHVFTVTKYFGSNQSRVSVSDGTAGSLELLFESLDEPTELTPVGEQLFFQRDFSVLWVSDGTPAGTHEVGDFSVSGRSMGPLDGRLVFIPREEEDEIWETDGSPAGTRRLLDAAASGLQSLSRLIVKGSTLYFVGESSANGTDTSRIYRSDGTSAGTRPLTPTALRTRQILGFLNNRIVFSTFQSQGPRGRFALRITTADPENATLLGEIGRVEQVVSLRDELWLLNIDGGLFRTDGTPAGTGPAVVVPPEVTVLRLDEVPGHLLLRGVRSGDDELWVTDGTSAGTRKLGAFETLGFEFFLHEGRVVFTADGGKAGIELWAANAGTGGPPPPPPPNPSAAPEAPRNLRAVGMDRAIRLTWEDASSDEDRFVVQVRSREVGAVYEQIAMVPQNVTTFEFVPSSFTLQNGPTTYRVRAENAVGASEWSREAAAMPVSIVDTACDPESSSPQASAILCLQNGRFQVRSYWRSEDNGKQGFGRSTAFDFSDDSGTFWFFDPANVELVVKVLDARVVNDFFWNFYGALSNVEYWVVVTDTKEATNVTYYNPPGNLCGVGDTSAFPRPSGLVSTLGTDAGAATCVPGPNNLCLTPDRYRVEVSWRDPRSGDTGVGHAIPGTADSGYFWFFDPANVELVVKVLDATAVNGHTWVFFGALTDIEYTVTVKDTLTNEQKTYSNPPGNLCGQADVTAF